MKVDDSSIVRNSIITRDGTVLTSYTVHDYKSHMDSVTNTEVSVDGGNHYLKRSGQLDTYTENSIVYGDGHKVCREVKLWGTYGKNGDEPLKFVSASEMTSNHIMAILNGERVSGALEQILKDEIKYRES